MCRVAWVKIKGYSDLAGCRIRMLRMRDRGLEISVLLHQVLDVGDRRSQLFWREELSQL